eukprot:scaffold125505_cov63-Phaeocystis_antarctica.AAC.1
MLGEMLEVEYRSMAKVPPLAAPQLGSCASSGRARRLWAAPGTRPAHCAPSDRLGRSSQPPPKPPVPLRLTTQAAASAGGVAGRGPDGSGGRRSADATGSGCRRASAGGGPDGG